MALPSTREPRPCSSVTIFEIRMIDDHRLEPGFTPFGRRPAVFPNEINDIPPVGQFVDEVLAFHLACIDVVRTYISGELPTGGCEVVGELRVQEDERDACPVDQFCRCLARLLVHRDHHNEIDLLGDEVLDLAEFRRNALLRIKAKQIDTLLCRLSLHRVVDCFCWRCGPG